MAEDRIPLLERPGKGNNDDDEDFSPRDETVKSHQDFFLETPKTSTSLVEDKLKVLEREKNKANKIIMKRFPNYNPQKSPFTAIINELGKVSVFLGRINAREFSLLINDEINPDLPKTIVDALGPQEEVEMTTPKTSTGRETLRPKKFGGEESQWGPAKTPQLKKNITNAMKTVKENFPNLDHSKLEEFSVNINEAGEITVKGSRSNAVPHNLFDDDGNININIPQTIRDILGKQISSKGLRDQLEIVKESSEGLRVQLENVKESSEGLRVQLENVKESKNLFRESMKKMGESIKTKDELKKQDDVIKEKEKETIRLKELEELIKTKDEIIKSKDDEIKTKDDEIKTKVKDAKDVTVIEQMSVRDMEEAKKEIEKITNEFKLEREKKINAEKKIGK